MSTRGLTAWPAVGADFCWRSYPSQSPSAARFPLDAGPVSCFDLSLPAATTWISAPENCPPHRTGEFCLSQNLPSWLLSFPAPPAGCPKHSSLCSCTLAQKAPSPVFQRSPNLAHGPLREQTQEGSRPVCIPKQFGPGAPDSRLPAPQACLAHSVFLCPIVTQLQNFSKLSQGRHRGWVGNGPVGATLSF